MQSRDGTNISTHRVAAVNAILAAFVVLVCAHLTACEVTAQRATRAEAEAQMLRQIPAASLAQAKVYAARQTVAGGANVGSALDPVRAPLQFAQSWLFFVDDAPTANWEHPCRYVFVDSATRRVSIVNGKLPPDNWGAMELLKLDTKQ